ncbi:MAG: hypothetical protein ACLP2F_07035 [Steroidobacteraceae bacterium]
MSCELYGDIDERDQEVLSIRITIDRHMHSARLEERNRWIARVVKSLLRGWKVAATFSPPQQAVE